MTWCPSYDSDAEAEADDACYCDGIAVGVVVVVGACGVVVAEEFADGAAAADGGRDASRAGDGDGVAARLAVNG